MEIRCSKNDLLNGLALVNNIITEKQSISILSCVLIETIEDQIYLSATDLKIGLEYNFKAEIIKPGSVTVHARKLFNIIKELPDKSIDIIVGKNNNVEIFCDKSDFKILGLSRDEYPNIPKINDNHIIIAQKIFKDILNKTSFAMSNDRSRYVLNGLYCIIKPEESIFVTTDGRRLSFVRRNIETDITRSIIIPSKMIIEIQRILNDEGDLEIIIGEKEISFKFDNIRYISQLIDGTFPDYRQVIPEQFLCSLEFEREEFLNILKRGAVLSTQDMDRMKFEIKQNKINFSSKAPEMGEYKEDLDIKYEGNDVTVMFNPHYILDGLKNIKEEKIYFELIDSDSAGVITTGNDFKYIIMPMIGA